MVAAEVKPPTYPERGATMANYRECIRAICNDLNDTRCYLGGEKDAPALESALAAVEEAEAASVGEDLRARPIFDVSDGKGGSLVFGLIGLVVGQTRFEGFQRDGARVHRPAEPQPVASGWAGLKL